MITKTFDGWEINVGITTNEYEKDTLRYATTAFGYLFI